jgi:hypothetical protein
VIVATCGKIADAIRWHDGKPFTAQDVKCTWDTLGGRTNEKFRLNPRKSWYRNLEEVTTKGDDEVEGSPPRLQSKRNADHSDRPRMRPVIPRVWQDPAINLGVSYNVASGRFRLAGFGIGRPAPIARHDSNDNVAPVIGRLRPRPVDPNRLL